LESLGKCVVEFEVYYFHVRFDKKNKNLPNNRIYDVDMGGGNGATGVLANRSHYEITFAYYSVS
jgi:hypothetical protein